MLKAGNAQLAIAAALGARKNTVHRWLKGWRVAGTAALEARKHGCRQQAQRLLDANQVAEIQRSGARPSGFARSPGGMSAKPTGATP
jgi:hypothetical protein